MNEEGDVVKLEINFTIPRKSFGRSPDYQVEAAKKKMIREILKDLKRRFDGFQQNVAGFQMVHQKQNLVSLRKNVAFVAPFFQHLGFDTEKAGNEFTAFQIILATFTEKRSIEENLQLIREKDWPDIEMIFMGSLCLPLDNAMSERGFSTEKKQTHGRTVCAYVTLNLRKGFRFQLRRIGRSNCINVDLRMKIQVRMYILFTKSLNRFTFESGIFFVLENFSRWRKIFFSMAEIFRWRKNIAGFAGGGNFRH